MNYAQAFGTGLIVVLAVISVIGYVFNIIELLGMDLIASTEVILRFIGIAIPPLGVFMGLFI